MSSAIAGHGTLILATLPPHDAWSTSYRKKCTIHELHAHKQKKSQERSRIGTFQGGAHV